MNAASEERTPEQVRAEIEQTREQLGETVEALAAKSDVKGQAKRAVGNAKATVAESVSDARASVTETVTGARQTASAKKDDVVSAAQQATPESAGDAGQRVSRLVRDNRTTLIPAVALVLGVLVGRRRSR